jgi:hypothetical protein
MQSMKSLVTVVTVVSVVSVVSLVADSAGEFKNQAHFGHKNRFASTICLEMYNMPNSYAERTICKW